jgi:hypothetical protein
MDQVHRYILHQRKYPIKLDKWETDQITVRAKNVCGYSSPSSRSIYVRDAATPSDVVLNGPKVADPGQTCTLVYFNVCWPSTIHLLLV